MKISQTQKKAPRPSKIIKIDTLGKKLILTSN